MFGALLHVGGCAQIFPGKTLCGFYFATETEISIISRKYSLDIAIAQARNSTIPLEMSV